MSKTRVSREASNEMIQGIARMRAELDAMKATQLVGGTDVLGYFAASSADYDYVVAIPASSRKTFGLQFVVPNTLYAPLAQLFAYYSFNPKVLNDPVPPYANGANVTMNLQEYPLYNQIPQWYVTFTNNTTSQQTVYMKLVINSSATGTINIYPQ